MRIALVDDEPESRSEIARLVGAYLARRAPSAELRCFASARELLDARAFGGAFDVYVLDIVMPEQNGIELAAELRAAGDAGAIIYLTTSPDFALESYETQALHYLLKPVDAAKLYAVLDRALSAVEAKAEKSIVLHDAEGGTRLLELGDIAYAELRARRVRYTLISGEVLTGRTLTESFRTAVQPLLADDRFFLCGASYALNLAQVQSVRGCEVVFRSGARISVPRRMVGLLKEAWSSWWLARSAQNSTPAQGV